MIARLGGRRRLVLFAALALAGLLAGALTAVQIRAAQALDRRDDAALAAQQETAEAEAEAEAEARGEAYRRELAETWTVIASRAQSAVLAAEEVLAASAGAVADDAVRVTLADWVAEVRVAVDLAGAEPTPGDLSGLRDAMTGLALATTAVERALAEWQAAQQAAAAAADPSTPPEGFRARGWPYDGAGPDCGSPASYEPSQGGTFHTSAPTADGDGTNGNLPQSAMTALSWCTDVAGNQQWLRSDAAAALVSLNEAFRAEFGENIAIDLSYRSYADQVRAREIFGSLAARPGTSNHGFGTAFDTWEWQAYSFGSARYEWLVANGPAHGWVCPAATESGNPEYWHFEYTGTSSTPAEAHGPAGALPPTSYRLVETR